jgi:hypothetical protein
MATPANINNPSGFTAVKHSVGGTPVRVNSGADYAIAGALASNIYRGSLVKPTGTGTNIDVIAAGQNPSIGAFHGVSYVDANGDTQFRPRWLSGQTIQTGSTPEAYVFDDPQLLFDAQVSGTAGLANTNIGNSANILVGTGSSLTGQSGDMVDQSTLSSSSTTQQLQVQSLRQLTNNNYGQYARALVSIFLHYKNAVAGAGVIY